MLIGAFFTGTGTTEKVIDGILDGIISSTDFDKKHIIDFSLPKDRENQIHFEEGDLVVIGTFVVAGRLPNLIVKYLKSITYQGASFVPVVLYGNRDYQDALGELRDIITGGGGKILGGGAFVGEHSFSQNLAKGRPDDSDISIAFDLGEKAGEKYNSLNLLKAVEITGNKEDINFDNIYLPEQKLDKLGGREPYFGYYKPMTDTGEHIDIRKVKPVTGDECVNCGLCIRECRMGAISENPKVIDGICIKCCHCVKSCPVGAKKLEDKGFIFHKEDLERRYKERKEPTVFI